MSPLITTDVERAAAAIRSGGLVAVPTETVYGLAADATDPAAIARIYATKGRPSEHPLIVHLADPLDIERWAPDASKAARLLAAAVWPGPVTVIVPRSPELPAEVAGGRDTVGLRVPAHPMTQQLIRLAGRPIAAPSANRFGAVSPTTATHVADDLGDRLDPATDLILDGGPAPIGVESTIVDCTIDPPQLLRAGAVTADQAAELIGASVAAASGPARASGMLASHYAPRCQVRLVDHPDDAAALAAGTSRARILDHGDDLARYARDLYAELRRADADEIGTLIAVLPPAEGLGHAIIDRLTKAAAPRG
ncbi:MAG: L-threonylcarbamoyladenylate synthase [Ilumatobacter sp.]|jgi:L-threonylcarbamoyladenylate synthase|uniref:L-threonylcarbamoyladenylate synthase n=1 Tax=Ilumatobacter sp. TaxID=1967498 RepID=UPI00391971D1